MPLSLVVIAPRSPIAAAARLADTGDRLERLRRERKEERMGPLTLEQFTEKLAAQHPERKLAVLGQLWQSFGLHFAFLESSGANTFAATVVAEESVGTLKEVAGLLALQLTPFREVVCSGMRERADSVQLFLMVGEKELHLTWPCSLAGALEDPTFGWLIQRVRRSFDPNPAR
jgi:hypothetical protein